MELLKKHYITPELIQSYEIEFNDMCQGTQEHPQIFLSRLREAADLANISNEAVIESRFKAGLHTWYRGPYAGLRPELDGA
ncbi:hypothetical protein G6F38_013700 [Rhizopus arrhizus]|nr:hypothetical protein G6F38_013700 [Rhizopus arrhizus]